MKITQHWPTLHNLSQFSIWRRSRPIQASWWWVPPEIGLGSTPTAQFRSTLMNLTWKVVTRCELSGGCPRSFLRWIWQFCAQFFSASSHWMPFTGNGRRTLVWHTYRRMCADGLSSIRPSTKWETIQFLSYGNGDVNMENFSARLLEQRRSYG